MFFTFKRFSTFGVAACMYVIGHSHTIDEYTQITPCGGAYENLAAISSPILGASAYVYSI